MSHTYDWAFNAIKLQQSIESLTQKKSMDQSVQINEASIKAEYIARGGLIRSKSASETAGSSRGAVAKPADENTDQTTNESNVGGAA